MFLRRSLIGAASLLATASAFAQFTTVDISSAVNGNIDRGTSTFPVGLSRLLVNEFRRRGIAHQLMVLPCGHYSTGVTPFKWMDGLTLCRFLARAL